MRIQYISPLILLLIASNAIGQTDSTGSLKFGPRDYVKKLMVIIVDGKNVSVNPDLAFPGPLDATDPVKREIQLLETRESYALQRRDTAELKKLWGRDFTADIPANRILTDDLGLPYYESYHRIVEHLDIKDGQAYSNGTEIIRLMDDKTKTITTITKKYVHIWKMGIGGWRLFSKFGYEVNE
jgi:hypothetical protein